MPKEFETGEEKFIRLQAELYDLLREIFDAEDLNNFRLKTGSADMPYGSPAFLKRINDAMAAKRGLEGIIDRLLKLTIKGPEPYYPH